MSRFGRLALLLLFMGACEQGGSDPPPVNENAQLVRQLFDAWNTGDLSAIRMTGGDTLRFHYMGESSLTTLDDLEGLIAHWRTAFPDLRMDVHDIVADGDLVAARVQYSGTHQAAWFGIAPTGRSVVVDEMMFFRFEEGVPVEAWEVDDQWSMRTQLGLVP